MFMMLMWTHPAHCLRKRATLSLIGACLSVLISTPPAWADKTGCEYKDIDVARFGQKPFQNPPEIVSSNGALKTNLAVQYTNPATTTIADCPVHLRTYNGQLVGPTLRAKPGDVLDILLDNQLPTETTEQIQQEYNQEIANAHLGMFPAGFNTTNLHTHGLHVSPSGNSDNVLLNIEPQKKFSYEIKTPSNHPPGTFWYHAHAHGSTAIQVGSGMAGALILDDDRARIPPALAEANKGEKVMVLQTTLYNENGELNDIIATFPSPTNPNDCQDPRNRMTWLCSKRRVTINGQIVPRIKMQPGEVQRWRIIDAAFRQTFELQLDGHPLHEIALDGLYLGHIDTWPAGRPIELQPGYRTDVLVQASQKPGIYKLVNSKAPAASAISGVRAEDVVIAEVEVTGAPKNMALPTDKEMAALAPFPGVDLRKSAIGVQEAAFKLGSDLAPSGSRNYFQVNYQAFDTKQVRKLVLNAVDLWSLTTVGDPFTPGVPPLPHVFHIHVNPFQMLRKDPSGAEELVWKDTVLVPGGQQLNVYTQYLDFLGQFVIHCHILDHEDLGMMEVVEVVQPESVPLLARPMEHK
jgi:FtsP/CotA-like multicopper oxidase with cupredoxin domain